jgi:hypothetical protein
MRRPDLKDREIRVCAACDSKFSPTSENEFCPVCMLREVLIGGVESGESLSQDPVKPAQQHATQRFEHYELVRREDGTPAELGRGAMGITYVQSVRRRSALHGDTESHQREVFCAKPARRQAFVTQTSLPYFTLGKPEAVTSTRWSLWKGRRCRSSFNAAVALR